MHIVEVGPDSLHSLDALLEVRLGLQDVPLRLLQRAGQLSALVVEDVNTTVSYRIHGDLVVTDLGVLLRID